jgi:ADP-ribose pyrophosphatase
MTDEKVVSSEMIYRGRVVKLRVDTITKGGEETYQREVIEHNGAVAIVALDEASNVYLVKQYRSGAGRDLIELPAGGLEPDEPRIDCARRELQEEIGMYPDELFELGSFFVAPSYTTENITIYLARGLRPSVMQGDVDEQIEVTKMPFKEALQKALANEFEDSKTVIGIMWAARRLSEGSE